MRRQCTSPADLSRLARPPPWRWSCLFCSPINHNKKNTIVASSVCPFRFHSPSDTFKQSRMFDLASLCSYIEQSVSPPTSSSQPLNQSARPSARRSSIRSFEVGLSIQFASPDRQFTCASVRQVRQSATVHICPLVFIVIGRSCSEGYEFNSATDPAVFWNVIIRL